MNPPSSGDVFPAQFLTFSAEVAPVSILSRTSSLWLMLDVLLQYIFCLSAKFCSGKEAGQASLFSIIYLNSELGKAWLRGKAIALCARIERNVTVGHCQRRAITLSID